MVTIDTGKAVRIAMAASGIGVGELASRMGVTHPAISKIRRAKHCKTDTVERLADALGMRPTALLALGESDHHED